MKIGLAQINPTVGDIPGTTRKIIDYARRGAEAGCGTVVFPELAVCGYPPRDLLLKVSFIGACRRALEEIARAVRDVDLLVGYPEHNPAPAGRPLFNAVALLRDGEIRSRHFKTLLPTYDVFDESRYFEPGPNESRNNLINIRLNGGQTVPAGVSVCEDLWNDERLIGRRLYHQNPILDLHQAGARLLINVSASPYVVNKHDFRRELFGGQVRQVGVPLVYVNQVGGNDELIFDGNSCVFDAHGRVIAQAKDFEEDLLVVDLEPAKEGLVEDAPARADATVAIPDEVEEQEARGNRIEVHSTGIASVHKALVLGTRDYMAKCGFRSVVLGLSGGIDSAVTCALAVEALGASAVTGVALPSRYSSQGSLDDAEALAQNLGIAYETVAIEPVHQAYEAVLADPLHGVSGLTEENLQARIRGAALMAFSNRTGALLLTTGNKSELAVGYCTLYGDMCGGLAVISDVPKTDVYRLAHHINQTAGREIIPQSTMVKPPSAELAPDQKDEDSLPPYDVLDAILQRYVELDEGPEQIAAEGFDIVTVQRVITLVDRSEYKRRQAAMGLKVTSRAFGFGRRMPVAQQYDHGQTSHGEPAPVFDKNPA